MTTGAPPQERVAHDPVNHPAHYTSHPSEPDSRADKKPPSKTLRKRSGIWQMKSSRASAKAMKPVDTDFYTRLKALHG